MKALTIYISGAITGMDRGDARRRFNNAAAIISARGHFPIDPFDIPNDAGCACPDAPDPMGSGHTWACCLKKDIRVLCDLDGIYLMPGVPERGYPGWETSHGARLELQVASAIGLRVFWSLESIPYRDFEGA